MTKNDKISVALWLRRQIEKLKSLPHYPNIILRVDDLQTALHELEAEIE